MNRLFELVEAYDTITIFRHVAADGDALGAQFGLKQWIKDTYPDKKVYCLGHDLGSIHHLFESIDIVEDNVVADSLAIVLDTANRERVDDARFLSAKEILKIDHHINVDAYAHYEIVNERASATCEVLVSMLRHHQQQALSTKCAQYLYYGLSSDTNNFTNGSVSEETFLDAAYLMRSGLDMSAIHYNLRSRSLNVFHYETFLRHNIMIEDDVAYCIVKQEDYQKYNLTFNEAKEKVYVMSGLKDIAIWCLFIEKENSGEEVLYNGSLRSSRIAINEIANHYHGGGHKNACGVKQLSENDIHRLIAELKQAK